LALAADDLRRVSDLHFLKALVDFEGARDRLRVGDAPDDSVHDDVRFLKIEFFDVVRHRHRNRFGDARDDVECVGVHHWIVAFVVRLRVEQFRRARAGARFFSENVLRYDSERAFERIVLFACGVELHAGRKSEGHDDDCSETCEERNAFANPTEAALVDQRTATKIERVAAPGERCGEAECLCVERELVHFGRDVRWHLEPESGRRQHFYRHFELCRQERFGAADEGPPPADVEQDGRFFSLRFVCVEAQTNFARELCGGLRKTLGADSERSAEDGLAFFEEQKLASDFSEIQNGDRTFLFERRQKRSELCDRKARDADALGLDAGGGLHEIDARANVLRFCDGNEHFDFVFLFLSAENAMIENGLGHVERRDGFDLEWKNFGELPLRALRNFERPHGDARAFERGCEAVERRSFGGGERGFDGLFDASGG